MSRSRLRKRLTGLFGLAVFVGLGALAVSLYVYHVRQADQRLTASLRGVAQQLAAEIETRRPWRSRDPDAVAFDELEETLAGAGEVQAVYREDGSLVGVHGQGHLLTGFELPSLREHSGDHMTPGTHGARYALVWTERPRYAVVAARTLDALAEENRSIAVWLLISVPLTGLFALFAGYHLAGRAFQPFEQLASEIDEVDPRRLERRLSVREPANEIDALASRFNDLLDRLSAAQEQNQAFLADVAHQLKTPLTVVRGESDLVLKQETDAAELRVVMERIHRASAQMAHRVDDLLLLARAEAGERPALSDKVDLDGLALDCTDMMRGRASEKGHRLELGTVEAATVVGNGPLLREVLLELIENAIRHGDPSRAIQVTAYTKGADAHIEVESAGPPLNGDVDKHREAGLGLRIMRWIAEAHRGELAHTSVEGRNTFRFSWPAVAS